MKFHKQLNSHDPKNGIYGDCHRTCIACILNLEIEDVPNFAQFYWGDTATWVEQEELFLNSKGYTSIYTAYDEIDSIDELLEILERNLQNSYSILIGQSSIGINHSVVCKGNKIIHDPSLSNSGIIAKSDDGFYHFEFILPLEY